MLRIHQNLMSKTQPRPEARSSKIYSHAQSLAQCHEWLEPEPAAAPSASRWLSNAEAARRAAKEQGAAAIAGETAAAHYGLNVLAANIEDEPNNTTRFLVLGDYEPAPSGQATRPRW